MAKVVNAVLDVTQSYIHIAIVLDQMMWLDRMILINIQFSVYRIICCQCQRQYFIFDVDTYANTLHNDTHIICS